MFWISSVVLVFHFYVVRAPLISVEQLQGLCLAYVEADPGRDDVGSPPLAVGKMQRGMAPCDDFGSCFRTPAALTPHTSLCRSRRRQR